jgi:predicted aconitase
MSETIKTDFINVFQMMSLQKQKEREEEVICISCPHCSKMVDVSRIIKK